MNNHIDGILQFNGLNNKKIDLIVSDFVGAEFIQTFDFEICKGVLDFDSLFKKTELNHEQQIELCANEVFLTVGMLRDLGRKTLSICCDSFTVENIHYFMNKHFLKLRGKFPDYELNGFIKNPHITNEKAEVLHTINAYKAKEKYEYLDGMLSIKEELVKKPKLKL